MNQNLNTGAQGQGVPSIPYWVASDIRIAIFTGLKILVPAALAAITVTLFLGGLVGDSFGSSSDDGLGYFPNLDLFRSVLGTLSAILGASLGVRVDDDFIGLEAYLLPVTMLPGIAAFLLLKYRPVAIHGDWRRALAFALKVAVVAGIAAFIVAAASGFEFEGFSESADDYLFLELNFGQTRAFFVAALMTGIGVLSSPVIRNNFSNLSLVNKVLPVVPIVIKSIALALLVFWVALLIQGGQAAELSFSDNATWMFWTTLTISVTISLLLMFTFLGTPPTPGRFSSVDSESLSASELTDNAILLWGGRLLFAALLAFFVYRHLVKTQPREREQVRDLTVGVIAISAITMAISSLFTKFSLVGSVDFDEESASFSVGFFSALLIPGLWAAGTTVAIVAYWGSRNGLPLFTVSPPPPTVSSTPIFQQTASSGTPVAPTTTPVAPTGSQPRPTFETPRIERRAPAAENIRNILDDLPAPTPSVAPNLSLVWISGSPVDWSQLGFQVRSSGQGSFDSYDFIDFPNLSLGFLNSAGGMSEYAPSWTWKASTDSQLHVDGISTVVSSRIPPTHPGTHFLKVASVNRVVLRTGSLDRTAAALTSALGTPPVDVHPHASGARQGVLQVGSVSLELIEQPNLDQSTLARIVGMVLLIDDFDTALEAFGPQRLGAVRTTTNGTQRSVTLRPELNLGLGIALKSKPLIS